MKRKLVALILTGLMLFAAGCTRTETPDNGKTTEVTATPEPIPTPVKEGEADVITSRWVAAELSFTSSTEYGNKESFNIIMDVVFTNRESGTTLKIPAFYDGDNTFKVRFAPTEYGIWDAKTECAQEASLNGITKTVGSNYYEGDLDIYKHGFIKTQEGKKYFVYADGTPFFYLGDTHWTMYTEELDSAGKNAGNIQTSSHFKYIVDKRVEQGFTVYQSEPINSPFSLTNGLSGSDLDGFQKADKYYQYIAQKGLVHANAEFFYPMSLTEKLMKDEAYLEKISRYWVARFGAYPVMWTLGQEVDNTFNYGNDTTKFGYTDNPWVKIAEYIHKYDAYSQPLTAHQCGSDKTTVTGAGSLKGAGGMSAFYYEEKFKNNTSTGHSWWASQWTFKKDVRYNEAVPKDYWASGKPTVYYEGRYCYQWTDDFGARVQGWVAFLNGMCGYGYGVIDVWYYGGTYSSRIIDGTVNEVTDDDLKKTWSEVLECPSTLQMGYLKDFLIKYKWWNFTPDFYDGTFFNANTNTLYANASDGNGTYIIYMYNRGTTSGELVNLEANATYSLTWFNPRSNEYVNVNSKLKGKSSYEIPQKPDIEDWVLVVEKG